MLQLISLLIIWAAGITMQYLLYGVSSLATVCLLCPIILAALYISLPTERFRYSALFLSAFLVLSSILPPLRPFSALAFLIIKPETSCFYLLPALLIPGMYLYENELPAAVITMLLMAAAFMLNRLMIDLQAAHERLVHIWDTSREQQLIVEEKNRALRESQDNSVHLATLQERNRIAREIHDNVGHMLTRSILQIGAVKTVNKDPGLAPLLDGLHDTLNTAMTNIRESVHDLHDESVDLGASIREILNTASGFHTTLEIDKDLVVPKKVKYGFIAIVKEAVNNTVKHSNGDQITVILREHPGFYQLLIEDNGAAGNIHPENGIGLGNIHDRVREMGGTVSIQTSSGFRYSITVMK